jgi:AcrR family transcriptional regulator
VSARPNLLAGEDLPPPPRQQRSREKRARIEAAGLALFAEQGFEATSVEQVARRAGLAVGGFYLHYRSKRQLLLALTDELLQDLERMDLVPPPARDVRTGLRALLSRALSRDLRYLGAYRAWQEAVLSDSDLEERHRQIHAWTTARVLNALRRMQRLPRARRGVDLPGLARVLDTMFWSFLAQAPHLPKPDVGRWVDAATHVVYHAMFDDSPRKE